MTRSFGSLDLVQLPKLDSISAQTLGTEMLTAAKDKTIPAAVAEALTDFATAHRALQSAVAQRLPNTASSDPAQTRAADAILDATWSALFDFLSGWSKLPDHANAALATDLLAQLYPEGLKFVLLAYKLEWSESNTRLLLIEERKLDGQLEQLGAKPILERLKQAHSDYGAALGVTSAAKLVAATVNLREVLDEFAAALRHYIVCVAASVRKKDDASAALANELLAPVERWQAPSPQASKPPVVEPNAPAHSTEATAATAE